MTKEKLQDLHAGFETAFINSTYASNLAYKPQFVSNNYKEGKKVYNIERIDSLHHFKEDDCRKIRRKYLFIATHCSSQPDRKATFHPQRFSTKEFSQSFC